MVTRKVGRSKRDAIAIAEAQLHASDTDMDKKKTLNHREKKRTEKHGTKETGPRENDVVPPPISPSVTTPRSISTRNRGSRPPSTGSLRDGGVISADVLRKELERKLEFIEPEIKARFGELVWAKRAGFPYWPALILDPRSLPEHELPNALKELDVKCWVQLYGSRDIRQILFTALIGWDDKSQPYREGIPKSDFHRLAKMKETFAVALNEASEQEKLSPDERLEVFTNEVVPSLGLPLPAPLPSSRKRRSFAKITKPVTPPAETNAPVPSTAGSSAATQLHHTSGLYNKASPSSSTMERRAAPAVVTHDSREKESSSRYRLGQLSEYATKLQAELRNPSSDKDWKVQLLLSQLLDEKAFVRRDIEKAGILELINEVSRAYPRWNDLVETIRVHLTNCTLEEWPPTQRTTVHTTSAPKRPASSPPLIATNRVSTDPKRHRVGPPGVLRSLPDSSTINSSSTPNGSGTHEAMAEAVARSMISRASVNPTLMFCVANTAPLPDSTVNDSSPTTSDAPILSSSAAMTSVGINPPAAATLPVGTMLFATSAPGETATDSSSAAKSTTGVSTAPQEQSVSLFQTSTNTQPAQSRGRSQSTNKSSRSGSKGYLLAGASQARTSTKAQTPTMLVVPPVYRTNPSLVIFNKDGTLLDFQSTWTSWIESQAWRLETALGKPIRDSLFEGLGYNPVSRTMRTGGVFNTSSKHELARFAVNFLQQQGLQYVEAVRLVNLHWSLPKEVATFRARRDLPSLFKSIRELGVKIAILTTDRRDVTSKTLTHLGVGHLVDVVGCGDDGVTNTQERIWALCNRLGVSPANTVMVGDTADDMILGRTAGCALSVGVLGGASDVSDLSLEADLLVPCVTNVVKLLFQYRQQVVVTQS